MKIEKTNCYQVNHTINNTEITGYVIIYNEDDRINFFETFEEITNSILHKHPYISSISFNKKIKQKFPNCVFYLTLSNQHKKFNDDIRHESYGIVRFFNSSGGARNLFGSSIRHNNTISFEICHAYENRTLHKDNQFSSDIIVRAEMSKSQFADMITSLGEYSGTPCTIRYTELDGDTEYPEITDKKAVFRGEFKQQMTNAGGKLKESISEIQELFNKKSLNKKDKEKILNSLYQAYNDITSNSSFLNECFAEQMEHTVHEAKGEIEAYIDNKIRGIANEAIAEQIKKDKLLEDVTE